MKGKKNPKRIKAQEAPSGDLQTFKVRCSLEHAFYLLVEAHDSDEAERVAEDHCRQRDAIEDNFWQSEASYLHSSFEAEET